MQSNYFWANTHERQVGFNKLSGWTHLLHVAHAEPLLVLWALTGWARSTCCWTAILQLCCPSNGWNYVLTHPGCDTDLSSLTASPLVLLHFLSWILGQLRIPVSIPLNWPLSSVSKTSHSSFSAAWAQVAQWNVPEQNSGVCEVFWSRQADCCWSYWHHCRLPQWLNTKAVEMPPAITVCLHTAESWAEGCPLKELLQVCPQNIFPLMEKQHCAVTHTFIHFQLWPQLGH